MTHRLSGSGRSCVSCVRGTTGPRFGRWPKRWGCRRKPSDAVDVVPVAENTAILEARYKQLGGQITIIHKPGVGHHPHSLKDPAPIVDFVVRCVALRVP